MEICRDSNVLSEEVKSCLQSDIERQALLRGLSWALYTERKSRLGAELNSPLNHYPCITCPMKAVGSGSNWILAAHDSYHDELFT